MFRFIIKTKKYLKISIIFAFVANFLKHYRFTFIAGCMLLLELFVLFGSGASLYRNSSLARSNYNNFEFCKFQMNRIHSDYLVKEGCPFKY